MIDKNLLTGNCEGFIAKPFDLQEVLKLVEKLIGDSATKQFF